MISIEGTVTAKVEYTELYYSSTKELRKKSQDFWPNLLEQRQSDQGQVGFGNIIEYEADTEQRFTDFNMVRARLAYDRLGIRFACYSRVDTVQGFLKELESILDALITIPKHMLELLLPHIGVWSRHQRLVISIASMKREFAESNIDEIEQLIADMVNNMTTRRFMSVDRDDQVTKDYRPRVEKPEKYLDSLVSFGSREYHSDFGEQVYDILGATLVLKDRLYEKERIQNQLSQIRDEFKQDKRDFFPLMGPSLEKRHRLLELETRISNLRNTLAIRKEQYRTFAEEFKYIPNIETSIQKHLFDYYYDSEVMNYVERSQTFVDMPDTNELMREWLTHEEVAAGNRKKLKILLLVSIIIIWFLFSLIIPSFLTSSFIANLANYLQIATFVVVFVILCLDRLR